MSRFLFLLVFLFPAFLPSLAWGFRLDPVVTEIPITIPKATTAYTVENNTKNKVAVQFEVRRRLVDVNGAEERPEATGFVVYPEQMALEPGEKRNVRVSWLAESMPTQELAYRFVASQLPVDFSNQKGAASVNLKFLIEYVASLYLVPPKVKPKMKVVSQKVKGAVLEILVANEGSAHQLLERMEISLQVGKKTTKVSNEVMLPLRTENVLAGGQRLLKLTLPAGADASSVAIVNFNP